jgi:hypothetical protein
MNQFQPLGYSALDTSISCDSESKRYVDPLIAFYCAQTCVLWSKEYRGEEEQQAICPMYKRIAARRDHFVSPVAALALILEPTFGAPSRPGDRRTRKNHVFSH